MKKIIAITAVLIATIGASAQNYSNNDDMNTLFGNDRSFGGYLGFGAKLGELNDQEAMFLGGELSMVFGHALNIGVAGYGLVSDVTGINVNDQSDRLFYDMGYGGVVIEPVLFSKSAIHFTVPLLFGAGGIGESQTRYFSVDQIDNQNYGDPDYFNSDFFFVFEPGVNLELNLLKFARVYGGVSYRYMSGVDLPNTGTQQLGGLTGNFGFRFGWF